MVRDNPITRRLRLSLSLSLSLSLLLASTSGASAKEAVKQLAGDAGVDHLNVMLLVCVCIGFIATIVVLIYFEFDTRRRLEKKFQIDIEALTSKFNAQLEAAKTASSQNRLDETLRQELGLLVQERLDKKAELLLENINAVDNTLSRQVQEITGSFTKQVKMISDSVAKQSKESSESLSKEAVESSEEKLQSLRAEYKNALKAMAKVVDQQMTAVQKTIADSRKEVIDLLCASQFVELLDNPHNRLDASIDLIRKHTDESKIIELAQQFPSANVIHVLRLLSNKKPSQGVAERLLTSSLTTVDKLIEDNHPLEAANEALQIIDAGRQLNAPTGTLLAIVKKVAHICRTTKDVALTEQLHEQFVKIGAADRASISQADIDEMLKVYKAVYASDKAADMHRLIQHCMEAVGKTLDTSSLKNLAQLANVLISQTKIEEAQVVLLNIASDLTKATDSSDEELIALLKNALNQLLLQGHLREAEVAGWQFFEAYKTKKEDQAARETLAQLRAIAKEYHKANNFKEAGALDLRKLRALSDIAAEPGDELQALDDLCESYLKGAEFVELAKLMPEVMNKYQDAYGEEGEEFIERKIFAVDVFSKVHEYDRATELLQTALAAATKRWGEFGEKTVALLNTLADLYNKQARYADAERLYRQVMEHQESTSDQNVGKTYTKLGEILSLQKDYEQSESFLKKALEMAEAASDAESQEVLPALMYLASLYMTTGRYKDAEPCYKRILEIKYKIYGEHSGEIIASLIHLGELYNLQNNFAESEVLLETALETAQRIYSHDDERLAAVMFQYARVLTQVGKDDEGERLHARAEKIRLGQQIQDDARQTEAQSQH